MSKDVKHYKWPSMKRGYVAWWENLTLEQKVEEKRLFELKRLANKKRISPYPDMQDLTHIRLSQLSDKQICRIWTFKDRPVAGFEKT